MIEIFSEDRTRNYGRYAHFKAAKDTLDRLRAKGEIAGEPPAVLVMCYKGTELQRIYTATFNGRWRVPKEAKTPDAGEKLRAKGVPQNNLKSLGASVRKKRKGVLTSVSMPVSPIGS